MSAKTIWNRLKAYGFTDESTAAIMGNMKCESALKPNIVEKRCPISDEEYTAMVDAGGYDFERDNGQAYGYGLCQWTYPTRKRALLALAKQKGVSVSDEAMQIEFLWKELTDDFSALKKYLLHSDNMYEATERFCKEFERPAFPNVQERYNAAQQYYNQFKGMADPVEIETPSVEEHPLNLETVCYSNVYSDTVVLLQALLNKRHFPCGAADGFFGVKTQSAVNRAQAYFGIEVDGIAGQNTWAKLMER